jgi:hypothetical protein
MCCSNQGLDAGYIDWGFLLFSPESPKAAKAPPSSHSRFVPNPFQFVIRQSSCRRCYTAGFISDTLSRFPYYVNAFVSRPHELEIMTGIKNINRHVDVLIIKWNKDELRSTCIYKPVHELLFVIVAPLTAVISKSYSSRYCQNLKHFRVCRGFPQMEKKSQRNDNFGEKKR